MDVIGAGDHATNNTHPWIRYQLWDHCKFQAFSDDGVYDWTLLTLTIWNITDWCQYHCNVWSSGHTMNTDLWCQLHPNRVVTGWPSLTHLSLSHQKIFEGPADKNNIYWGYDFIQSCGWPRLSTPQRKQRLIRHFSEQFRYYFDGLSGVLAVFSPVQPVVAENVKELIE